MRFLKINSTDDWNRYIDLEKVTDIEVGREGQNIMYVNFIFVNGRKLTSNMTPTELNNLMKICKPQILSK